MIKNFFFLVPCLCIENTDRFSEKHRQFLLDRLRLSFQKSLIDFICRCSVVRNDLIKPFTDLQNKNFADFLIRNDQLVHAIFSFSKPCEISGCKKHTPYIVDAVVNFVISQIRTNSLFNCISRNQLFDFIFGSGIGLFNKMFHKIISAAVDPIGFGLYIWITQ